MTKRIPKDTFYFTYRQENPKNKSTGDCVIRAIASAMQKDWDTVYDDLCKLGKKYKLMPNDEKCYERYLKDNGWVRQKQPRKEDNTKYTGKEFSDWLNGNKKDRGPVIVSIGTHHLSMIEWGTVAGYTICDSWDCSNNKVGKYWVKI